MLGTTVKGCNGSEFRIISEIGRGGFGIVYLAEDIQGKKCAIKVVFPASDPEVCLSFQQEVQSTIGLNHENLVAVFDYGNCSVYGQNGLFVAVEYCAGGDYRTTVKNYADSWPGLETIVQDIRQVLLGLETLHTKTVHRDLKPENVMVNGKELKIGDYGLSKFMDHATRTLTFKGSGTPRYMAPEVWLMAHITPGTDLYAVGVMLFELLTSEYPFDASDINELRRMHLYQSAHSVKSYRPSMPDMIDGIVRRLLAKESTSRYQTARDVLNDLDQIGGAVSPPVSDIASRILRYQHNEDKEREQLAQRDEKARDDLDTIRYKENEVLESFSRAISEVNSCLPGSSVTEVDGRNGRDYHFGNRVLEIRFFQPDALYTRPKVPGRMRVLQEHHVIHAGRIDIKEDANTREGWNLVLMRPPGSIYGDWRLVETRHSGMSRQRSAFEPFGTSAELLADNLACHLNVTMHVYQLADKPFECDDILRIIGMFIPE